MTTLGLVITDNEIIVIAAVLVAIAAVIYIVRSL